MGERENFSSISREEMLPNRHITWVFASFGTAQVYWRQYSIYPEKNARILKSIKNSSYGSLDWQDTGKVLIYCDCCIARSSRIAITHSSQAIYSRWKPIPRLTV